jgi:hypothetical protein
MRRSRRRSNPFAFLFGENRREQHLERYVLREHRRGRALSEILDDAYVRNWSTPEERGRLLERPAVVAGVAENTLAELRRTVGANAENQVPGTTVPGT